MDSEELGDCPPILRLIYRRKYLFGAVFNFQFLAILAFLAIFFIPVLAPSAGQCGWRAGQGRSWPEGPL
jgi:hypothetical protein